MKDRWTKLGVLIPLVGLVFLVVRAEVQARSGVEWRFEIRGYDPRDLVHGHYLRYRYVFDWSDTPSSCGPVRQIEENCCLCLSTTGAAPDVRQVSCSEAPSCESWIRASNVKPPLRYLVPEDQALALERAVATRKAELAVRTSKNGDVAVGMLYLDGIPWREALFEPSEGGR